MQGCRLLLNYGSKSIAAECHLLRAAEQNQSGSHASSLIERLFYASKQFIVFLHAWCSFTTLINKICKTTKKLNPKSSSDASVIVNQYPASVREGNWWGYSACNLWNPQWSAWLFFFFPQKRLPFIIEGSTLQLTYKLHKKIHSHWITSKYEHQQAWMLLIQASFSRSSRKSHFGFCVF